MIGHVGGYHADMLPTLRGDRQANSLVRWSARLRGAAFDFLYGPGARLYDRFTDLLFLGEWARWQETALPPLPPAGLIVELGAGTGRLAAIGARPERRWIALEPSPSMRSAARRQIRGTGASLVRATARSIPLRDGAADAVVATFPTPYIHDRAVHAEVARILAPEGRFVVVLDGALAPDGWRRRLRCRALRRFYGTDGQRASAPFSVAQLQGRTGAVRTLHGAATRYVGILRDHSRAESLGVGNAASGSAAAPAGYERR